MLSINRGPLLKRKITTVWQKKKQTSTIKQKKNTSDLGMEQEHKNQDHKEKYFFRNISCPSSFGHKKCKNSLGKILRWDTQVFFEKTNRKT